ncbi:MAG: penicillin-binding protein 2, partial [Patescibacteria group bacterium]
FLVYAEPQTITDRNVFVAAVAPLMELDPDELGQQLSEQNRAWVPLGHKVDNTKTNALKALGLKGIGFEKEPKRYYPEASAAAHLLGFVGSDEFGRDKGYFGLEGYYDRELGGKDGKLQLEKDVRGAPILINQPLRIEPENGRTLELWLDRTVQRIVEQRLSEGITKYGAKEGSVIVMDPKTGGILAMASFPSYDPAKFTQFDRDLYKNPTVAASFEPGSTFKALVMAASLNEKKLTPTTTIDENGPVTIGEYTIRTWNSQYHGQITMSQVLQYSSNTGMVYVGRQLGKEAFLGYMKAFGFGTPTNIDLQDEFSPEIRSTEAWSEIDLATASFGQG